jgi:hypothetical protein
LAIDDTAHFSIPRSVTNILVVLKYSAPVHNTSI